MAKTKRDVIVTSGKRKTAIARATIKPGKGRIRINKVPLEILTPEVAKDKILEVLLLVEGAWRNLDTNVNVRGGGFMGQADAARMVIDRGLVRARYYKRDT